MAYIHAEQHFDGANMAWLSFAYKMAKSDWQNASRIIQGNTFARQKLHQVTRGLDRASVLCRRTTLASLLPILARTITRGRIHATFWLNRHCQLRRSIPFRGNSTYMDHAVPHKDLDHKPKK
ncbi:hypothetical protein DOTSEDRAFT_74655 [Dothistroma septosporum NZE10]|uniref:Uncharacterized protein n=1 Tax=Dothistroma septosporum (strain NZE10 / CBS 128990) TaxID=675120 RepID=N1PCQ7_DOTSN|nr:hypothetical protein DOTSEDRAFT_74655 [Dothistroma septosporum NZE10]